MNKIKVLICDDDTLIRDALKIILSAGGEIEVVDTAVNGEDGVNKAIRNEVDVVLLDIRMPVMNGVEACKEIKDKTNSRVLVLTTFDEDEYIVQAIKNGASGYMLKSSDPKEIIDAIKIINNGNTYMQGDIMDKLRENIFQNNSSKKLENFTEREKQIIELISEGLSNKEISQKIFISEGTVKNYITSILNKTNLKHRTQIAIWYLK
ncbi:response regulator [Oceanirhabdus seepicola]|uniref:Stage 0 sporulation protein A homolog n=1 Tax=Oceanirhabdus seepicola TaxID=2828781 RepID=A0A9J6P3U8_9CLOT|nr:response regulator transcription factor [Oceanirhabdus seepicola]MCM1990485.1 response regulator transcription factor [Oceanirhabdus seepicola]